MRWNFRRIMSLVIRNSTIFAMLSGIDPYSVVSKGGKEVSWKAA